MFLLVVVDTMVLMTSILFFVLVSGDIFIMSTLGVFVACALHAYWYSRKQYLCELLGEKDE